MIDNAEISVRFPTQSELVLLPRIESEAEALFPHGTFPDDMGECSINELSNSLNDGYLYVAQHEGRVAGFAMTRLLGQNLHLQQLSVLPEYGRQGIGTALLKSVINLATKRGFQESL